MNAVAILIKYNKNRKAKTLRVTIFGVHVLILVFSAVIKMIHHKICIHY